MFFKNVFAPKLRKCDHYLQVHVWRKKPHINQVGYFLKSIWTLETDPARQNLNLWPLEVSFVRYGTFLGHILAVFFS